MAGRNQVTADLRISANAELQNSRAFINKLDKIIDGFDFGDKMNKQLLSAQDQLKNLNKVLEKVQNKSVISDNELKELVKAGKEISNIVNKTEKLYSNFNDSDWKRYSKEYIAQIEKQEKEVARIKEKYAKETGGNFDKDFANLDKYKQKVNDLSKTLKDLGNSKDNRIQDRIDEENKALQEQFEILEKVKRVEEERKTKRQNAINSYNQNNMPVASSDGKVKVTKEGTRRDLANNEYQKMVTTFSEVSKKRQEILDSGKTEEQIQKELVALAKQYGIQNVKNTEQFNKQLKVLQEQKNFYKLLKNRDQLVTEQAVTEEFEKRLRLAKELDNIDRKVYLDNGFDSEKDLKVQRRRAESALNSSRVEVTGTGASLTKQAEDDIANEIVSATTEQTNKLSQEMTDTRNIIEQISQYAAKLATQSERNDDNNDSKDFDNLSNNLDKNFTETKKDVNTYTNTDNTRIADEIIRLGVKGSLPYGKELRSLTKDYKLDDDTKFHVDMFDEFNEKLQNEIDFLRIGEGSPKKALALLEETMGHYKIVNEALEKKAMLALEENKGKGRKGKKTQKDLLQLSDIQNAIYNGKDVIESVLKKQNKEKKKTSPLTENNFSRPTKKDAENLEKAAQQSQFLGNAFDEIKGKIGYFLSLNYIFDQMTGKISEAVEKTKEMDKDMTQIGLVLGKTSGQVWKSFNNYSQMAQRLNTTTSEVTQSMKLFYQQGLNTAEVNKMVEASAIAAALGESTMAEASETLTSIINSYNLSANEALMVTDKISQIAIVSAADFGELSTAIEKVASSAASAGLDLDHMMGYLAKMIETTREAPTNIGTALKTIVANFTQFKEDPSGLMEEGTEINKVDKALKSVGISLTDTNGEVRDLSDVLDELGGRWENLNRSQKSYLATQIAGTRQQSRFYALMNDYDRTLQLVAEGSNSAGKAQQQFALYSNSLQASANRLTNEWEKFFNSITQGNGLISNFNNILTLVMRTINQIGPIGTVIGLSSLILSLRKSINLFDTLKTKIKDAENLRTTYKNGKQTIKESNLSSLEKKDALKKLKSDYNDDKIDINTFFKNSGPEVEKYAKQMQKITRHQQAFNKIIDKSSVRFKSFRKAGVAATTSIKKGMTTLPIVGKQTLAVLKSLGIQMAKFALVMAAFQVASAAFKGIQNALGMNVEVYTENAEKARENASTINGLMKEYEELSQKVNKTASDQERLKEITEEVVKIDTELGNKLRQNVGLYNSNIEAMKEYSKEQEKIAAQETVRASKGYSNIGGFFGRFFSGDMFTEWWGSDKDRDDLKERELTKYRALTEARGKENNLNDSQMSILNTLTEKQLKDAKNNFSASALSVNIDDFDDKVLTDYINMIKGLNSAQQQSYNYFINNMNNSSMSFSELYRNLNELNLPEEIKEVLKNQLTEIMNTMTNFINSNPHIQDKAKAQGFAQLLPTDVLQRIIKPDASTMSSNDIIKYNENVGEFLQDAEQIDNFNNASKQGEEALLKFVSDLAKTGKYNQNFIDALYKTSKELNATKVKNAIEALGKIGNLDITAALSGTASQLDILNELASGNLNIKDINLINGVASINGNAIIAQQKAAMKAIEEEFNKEFERRQQEINNITNTEGNQYLRSTQNTLDKVEFTRKLKNQELSLDSNYENGYISKEEAKSKVWDYDSNTAEHYYSWDVERLEKEKNALGVNPRDKQMIGSAIAQQTISNDSLGIQDTSKMNENQKAEYIIKQNNLLEEQKNKLKNIDENSQEYYNTTYSIYTIQKDLKNVLQSDEQYQELNKKSQEELTEIAKETKGQYDKQKKSAGEVQKILQKQLDTEKRKYNELMKDLNKNLQAQQKYAGVFDSLVTNNATLKSLDGIKEAFNQTKDGILDVDAAQNTLANNFALIDALDTTGKKVKWDQEKLIELAKTQVQTSNEAMQTKINEMEVLKKTLMLESEDMEDWSTSTLTEVGKYIGGSDSAVDTSKTNAEKEATNLGISNQNWIDWSDGVIAALHAAAVEYDNFEKRVAGDKSITVKESSGLTLTVDNSGGGTVGSDDITKLRNEKINQISESLTKGTKKYSANRSGAIANLNDQIKYLKGMMALNNDRIGNMGKYLSGDLYNPKSGGDKNKFDPLIEKLEHFYNYLRKIEKLEAKINRLREERNLIDTSKNYYIDNLIEENKLLAEQQKLYSNYIRDEGEYLTELRGELTKKFSKWVTFDDEGVVQVKQTEFNINSEKQQEEYENFSELLGLYQEEYNTREENITKLTQAQIQQVENIAAAYEKVLARVTDVNDAIQKSIDLLEHDVTMSFSNIAKFDIFDEQAEKAVKGIREMFGFVNEYQAQIDKINKQISEGALKEFFRWDEDLGYYRSNDLLLEDKDMQKKYEKMGYSWSEIHTYVKQTAKASEQLKQSWEESTDKANSFAETLKSLLENSISTFTNLVSSSGDELNKIFDTFDRKMNNIDNESNLFGVASENLEDKYVTLVTATATLKQTIGLLNDKRVAILDTIKEQYSEFVDEINGYTVINKQAIEESDKLTDGQKAQLLSWYEAFNAYDELVEASEDRLVDYFNQILEMENEKRDAIINLKQSVHDELIARDQEEIDDLKEKYDKMSQLDNEYYNKLADKVNRARQLREDRQADSAIPQTQAQIAVLKTDNSGTRNSEILNLQKQLNEQLQSQADRDVDRELERIQREQQEREEDRQLTIAAMENVLTFKDENNWYWQEAQRIWAEGPESVTGFLRTSNEYMNISDEQRAQLFEELSNSVNTAFATLQTAAGITSAISDGIVKDKSDEEQAKLDNVNNNLGFIQSQLGQEGLAGKIDWANAENAKHLLEIQTNDDGNALKITTKLEDLYKEKIGPTAENLQNTVVQYLGKESDIWRKLGMLDATTGQVNTSVESGFTQLTDAVNKAITWISSDMDKAWSEYKTKAIEVFNYLSKEYGKQNAQTPDKNDVKLPDVKKEPTKNEPPKPTTPVKTDNSSGGTSKKTLKVGGGATAKTGAKIYSSYAGGSGAGQYYSKDPNYKVLQLRGNRALVRWHKLSSGYTGWFNKTDLTPYRKGGYVNYTGIAAVHGSKTSPEAFLSAKQTKLFEVLRDSLVATTNKGYTKEEKEATNTGYNIDNINIEVKELADVDSVEKMTRKVKEEIYKDATGRNNMAVRRR